MVTGVQTCALPIYAQVRDEYCARRDAVYEEMSRIPGVVCQKPGGALYMTVKLPVDNVEKFLVFMLEEFEDNGETAMFAPAEGFYATERARQGRNTHCILSEPA